MLLLTFFVCIVLNITLGKCETKNITVILKSETHSCHVQKNHTFKAGDRVVLITEQNPQKNIDEIWFISQMGNDTHTTQLKAQATSTLFQNIVVENGGVLEFKYISHNSFIHNGQSLNGQAANTNFESVCSTNVTVVPPKITTDILLLYITVGGVITSIILIAEAIAIFHYRNKVMKFNQHNHLLGKTSDSVDINDPDRYSTNPIQKARKMAQPPIESNRDSEIYEVPDITIGGVPFIPPLPSPPRPDPMRIPPSPSSTLRSNKSIPSPFPRPKPSEQDTEAKISVDQRPPVPLPQEEYYSVTQDENMYEPPPIQEIPTRAPPPKKLDKQLPSIPMESLKPMPLKATKPPITQARPSPVPSRFNEEKPTLPRFPDKKLSPPQNPDPKPPAQSRQALLSELKSAQPRKPFLPDLKPSQTRQALLPEPKPAQTHQVMPTTNNLRPIPGPSTLKITPPKPIMPTTNNLRPIPGPSTLKITPPKSKPALPAPNTPPPSVPTLEQQVKLFNDNRPIERNDEPETWDEDEWTYEPLYNI